MYFCHITPPKICTSFLDPATSFVLCDHIVSAMVVYYVHLSLIGRTIHFNMAKMLPDVVLETNVGPSSMNVLPPGVGFRYSVCIYVTSCTYVCRYVGNVLYFIIFFTQHMFIHMYIACYYL